MLKKVKADRLADRVLPREKRDVAYAVGGMGLVMTGAKVPGLLLFAKGCRGIERRWRTRNPDFDGGLRERWGHAAEFYESTHSDPTNRALHMVGIPMIVGGAAGLLAFRPIGLTAPLWWGSAGSFGVGWTLNFIGHGVYEKNAPAFADDPLSFIAGPAWDANQVRKKIGLTLHKQVEASA